MKKQILFIIALVAATALPAALRRLPQVTFTEGMSGEIAVENATTLKSANPAVISVGSPEGPSVPVSALRIGSTEIIYSDTFGPRAVRPVTVVPAYWPTLVKFFEDDPEISLAVSGENVVISGLTANPDTLRRAKQAASFDNQGRIVNQVTSSTAAVGELVREYLQHLALTNISVSAVGREVCLSGKLYDQKSIEQVGERVAAFLKDFDGIGVNTDGLKVVRQRILLDVELVQYDVTKAHNLGLKTPDQITGTFDNDFSYTSDSGSGDSHVFNSKVGISDVKVAVNLLKRNSAAKTMYHTTLSTQSGEEAEFQNGGTIHRNTMGTYTSDVKEIEYGFIVKAKPVIVDSDTLSLDITLDNKAPINFEGASNKDIDVKRYQTRSKYVVRPGETIALSGFNTVTEDETRDGTPFLSKIPLIGALFRNTGTSTSTKEMVLIVTVHWALGEETETARKSFDAINEREVKVEVP